MRPAGHRAAIFLRVPNQVDRFGAFASSQCDSLIAVEFHGARNHRHGEASHDDISRLLALVTPERAAEGTFRWLYIRYFESVDFRQLGDSTGHVRRLILEGIAQSKNAKGNERGSLPYARMEERHIRDIRDEKSDFPEAANGRLKGLRQLFRWAKTTGRISTNPAASVEQLGSSSEGFHTWTEEEVAQFEARHPVGTKAPQAGRCVHAQGESFEAREGSDASARTRE